MFYANFLPEFIPQLVAAIQDVTDAELMPSQRIVEQNVSDTHTKK